MNKVKTVMVVILVLLWAVGMAPSTWAEEKTGITHAERIQQLEEKVEALEKKEKIRMKTGYDDGFYLMTPDEKYRLKFNSWVHLLYAYQHVEGGNDTNTFSIRRAKLIFSGNFISKKLTYKILLNASTSSDATAAGRLILQEYWYNYKFANAFQIKVGQYKAPFNRQYLIVDRKLQFVDRPLTNAVFSFGRDLGIELHGNILNHLFEYKIAMMNGAGMNNFNANNEFMYNARFAVNPFGEFPNSESDLEYSETPKLTIGTGVTYDEDDTSEDHILSIAGDAALKYRGFSVQGEFYYRYVNPVGNAANTKDVGYYAQVGCFIIPKHLEFALRASQVFLDGFDNDNQEYTAGINYYFKGENLKIQMDYSLLVDQDNIAGPNDEVSHRVRTQLQGFF